MQIPHYPQKTAARLPGKRSFVRRAVVRLGLCCCLFLGGLESLSCVGPAQRPILGEPEGHPGFPSETFVGDLWAEARFVENHARVLGRNLSAKLGIVPIAIRIGQRAGSRELAQLDPESLDPVLYLQNGTALPWVPLEELGVADDRIGINALAMTMIPNWKDSRAGFLFFSAKAAGVRLRGRHALVIKEHINLELDLPDSVLAITISTPDGPRRVHLGLGLERWEVER